MKTINKTSVSRRSGIAFLLATVSLLTLSAPPSRASIEAQFNASFITQFTTVLEFPILHVTVTGKGQATYMGSAKAFTDDQVSNLIDGNGSATYTLRAPNGKTLVLALVVQPGGTLNVEGGVIFSGTYTIIGGTGRFSGTTGSGVFAGSALFLTETDGVGSFTLVGSLATL